MAQLSLMEQEYKRYVDLPGVNFSLLKGYLRSPAHFLFEYNKWKNAATLKEMADEIEKEKQEFLIGKALHFLILQPDLFAKRYAFLDLARRPFPASDFKNGENKKWREERKAEMQQSGQTVISVDDYKLISGMAMSARKNKIVKYLLDGANTESVINWIDEETGVACKGMVDIDNPKRQFICDLKSVADASKYAFRKSFQSLKYYMQLPFYADGLFANDKIERTGMYFICIEKTGNFQVAVYSMDDFSIFMGRKTYKGLLALHKKCEEENSWKGYEVYADKDVAGNPNKYGIISMSLNDAEKDYIESHPLLIDNA